VLGIGVEPEVGQAEIGPQEIAGPDHFGAFEHPFRALPLDRDGGVEPRIKAKLEQPALVLTANGK
jgi:hypothetical protein